MNPDVKEKGSINEENYIPIREVCKIIGLKYKSIRTLTKTANIKTLSTPSGQTLYSKQSVLEYINSNTNIPEETTNKRYSVVYCRVSSTKQKDDLQRQIELARTQFPTHKVISDIASGINWERKGLQTILEYAMQRNLEELVVFHKDRLSRSGFDLIKKIIETSGGKVIVVDNQISKSAEQELAEDLLSIIHIYSCRQMGRRRYSRRKEDIKNSEDQTLPIEGTKENVETLA